MQRTYALRSVVAACVVVAAAAWSVGWGRNSGHLFGDPLLAREMMQAGRHFAAHGSETYGLPVYRPGAAPYTHLTPGPEWLQAAVAALQPPRVPPVLWHSLLTTCISLASLLVLLRALRDLLTALGVDDRRARDSSWSAALLIAAAPAFLIYAPHPYCAGTLLANTLALSAAAWWSRHPMQWRGALVRFAAALTAAFWLGVAPVVSASVWLLAASLRFGEGEGRRRRATSLILAGAGVLALCVFVKLEQSVALLGSWDAALRDAQTILGRRLGDSSEAATVQRAFLFRFGYLFAASGPLAALLVWRARRVLRNEWFLLAMLWAGALAWQIGMRGHAAYHIYMLRDAIVPLGATIALASASATTPPSDLLLHACAAIELVLVAAVLIVPLIMRGEPLWRLL
jgi:hypothetical protein